MHSCGGRRICKSSTAEVNVAFKGEQFQSILNGILVREDQPDSKVFILRPGTNARDVTVGSRSPAALARLKAAPNSPLAKANWGN
ncbi:uncharacterized protein G2W53_018227 [Senna tora]|uniref:Uncharacterized protein n=1 Tax=Senna tora TaxID=362788 RepID=A0A834TRM1_9FABA|nr:uncharacterized protein G2W53_018227 [Senna tora]